MNYRELEKALREQKWYVALPNTTKGRILRCFLRAALGHTQRIEFEPFHRWRSRAEKFDLSSVTEEVMDSRGVGPKLRECLRKVWPLFNAQVHDVTPELELAKHEWC